MIAAGNGGSIINIASLNAIQPAEGMGVYCAGKAAVDMHTKVAAMELGPHGIRVNAIAPGLVDTPLAALLNQTPPIHAAFVENAPLGRTGSPDDVAGVALFLASDDASWMTGDLVRRRRRCAHQALPRAREDPRRDRRLTPGDHDGDHEGAGARSWRTPAPPSMT